jgi:hypothetical protein
MSNEQHEDEGQPLLTEVPQQSGVGADPENGKFVTHAAVPHSAAKVPLPRNGNHAHHGSSQGSDVSSAPLALYGSHFLSTWGQVH